MSLPSDDPSSDPDDLTRDKLHGDGLDDLLQPRLSQRARLLRASLLVALVVVVTGGLLWRSAGFSLQLPTTPAPIPTFTSGPPGVRILSNIGFGSVSVNGLNLGTLPTLARLRPGSNTITLDAPPFRAHTCVLTWPFSESSDLACILNAFSAPQAVVSRGQHLLLRGELDIEVVGADLTTDECTHVLDIVEHTLDATALTTTVPAGSHIAIGGESPEGIPLSRVVSTDSQARLAVHAEAFAGRPCTSLLYGGVSQPYYAIPPPARSWSANVPILEQMTFVQADGRVLGQTPTMEGSIGVIIDVPSSGNTDWRIVMTDPPLSNQLTGNLCGGGVQTVSNVFNLTHPGESWGIGPSSDGGLEGCQLELDTYTGSVETVTYYLWRFGVLLAEEAPAHKILPQLPVASAREVAAFPPGA